MSSHNNFLFEVHPSTNLKILIVEDDPHVTKNLVREIKSELNNFADIETIKVLGRNFEHSSKELEAWLHATESEQAVCITDIQLSEAYTNAGIHLIQYLRKKRTTENLLLIAYSAYDEKLKIAEDLGSDLCIKKGNEPNAPRLMANKIKSFYKQEVVFHALIEEITSSEVALDVLIGKIDAQSEYEKLYYPKIEFVSLGQLYVGKPILIEITQSFKGSNREFKDGMGIVDTKDFDS